MAYLGTVVLTTVLIRCESIKLTAPVRAGELDLAIKIQADEPIRLAFNEHRFTRSEIIGTPICGENITEIANATWAYSARDGSIVTYTCDAGFQTSSGGGEFIFTCQAGQPLTSSSLPDSCNRVTCHKPAEIENADMIWQLGADVDHGVFGNVVDFACHTGYSGDGKARGPRVVKMVCDANGAFSFLLETIKSCQLIHCDAPMQLNHATLDSSIDKYAIVPYGSSIGYSCDTGFVVSTDRSKSGLTFTCEDDGEFAPNDPMPHCTESTCAELPVIPNTATIHVAGQVKIDTRVIYRCNEGYYVSVIPMSQTFFVRCDFINGKAQYVLPTPEFLCKAIACLPLPALKNAHVNGGQTGWRYNQTVPFSCNTGYALGGVKGDNEFIGYCNTQGIWTIDENPNCAPVICGKDNTEIPPDLLEYATLVPYGASPIEYQMKTRVTCIPGAVVVGTNGKGKTFEISCGADGDFTGDGLCAIPCSPVPRVSHSTSRDFGRIVEYGEPAAIITCKPGYLTTQGALTQSLTCSRDGKLTPIDPCVLANGNNGLTWGYEQAQEVLSSDKRSSASPVAVTGALVITLISIIF